LLLEGRDQKTIREHVENCAPCHIPNIDLYQNPALADDPEKNQACELCGLVDVTRKTGPMLLCDSCDSGWHMKCFTPPIKTRPKGDWFCPNCPLAASKNVGDLERLSLLIYTSAPSGRLRQLGGRDYR
jgi:hypothetical protein